MHRNLSLTIEKIRVFKESQKVEIRLQWKEQDIILILPRKILQYLDAEIPLEWDSQSQAQGLNLSLSQKSIQDFAAAVSACLKGLSSP